ncbi:MAG: hypothetical protein K6F46_03590 [Desulfovibrio sp.]|nr:hypothetical protein [Desulfovibrio sp.]
MTAEEKLARLIQIERRQKELQAEDARLNRERQAILGGKDTSRRSPAKRLSDNQIDAAFAGIIGRSQ